jgi:hypothetical protein
VAAVGEVWVVSAGRESVAVAGDPGVLQATRLTRLNVARTTVKLKAEALLSRRFRAIIIDLRWPIFAYHQYTALNLVPYFTKKQGDRHFLI